MTLNTALAYIDRVATGYGAVLARYLCCKGFRVIEVNQPDKVTRRRRGKIDVIGADCQAVRIKGRS
jgi:hypothetical protein